MLAGVAADVVCGGHTHQATDRRVGGTCAINLGSVSNPMTSDLRATYVIVDADRHGHRLTHRRVAYDHDAVIARLGAVEHPERENTSAVSSEVSRSATPRSVPEPPSSPCDRGENVVEH